MKIYASKNLGKLYYMVKDPTVIPVIVNEERIKASEDPEYGYPGGKKHHFISLMRSLDKAGRNPKFWVYGIQLDGTRLSDRYKIDSFSMASYNMRGKGRHFKVCYISRYDDDSCVLKLTTRPAFNIPRWLFDEIEYGIVNDLNQCNEKSKLEVTDGGKRVYRGKHLVKMYRYNATSGGLRLSEYTLSKNAILYLTRHTMLNETEERIWMIDKEYIDISGLITGYIEPEGDDTMEQYIDSGLLPPKNIFHYSPFK